MFLVVRAKLLKLPRLLGFEQGEERQLQIELFPYERRSLETLEHEFGVERKTVVSFAQSLNALRRIFEKVVGEAGHGFRGGRIVIMGVIKHARQPLAGGVQALEGGSVGVW